MYIELTLHYLKYIYYLRTIIFPQIQAQTYPEVWDFCFTTCNSKKLLFLQNVGKQFQFSWIEFIAIFVMESWKMQKLN